MVGMARSNFPSLPAFPTAGVVKIPSDVLRQMIAKTIFAISNEESRYTLNGALLVLKPESIVMVATDGHRLAHIERANTPLEVSGEMKTLVPKKAMAELLSLLGAGESEFVEFAKDDTTLFFRLGSRLLTSRQLPASSPTTKRCCPRTTPAHRAVTMPRSGGHPARRAVCRRALRRHPPAAGEERAEDLARLRPKPANRKTRSRSPIRPNRLPSASTRST